jgi:uncharacterized protein (DUF885 family)
MSLERAREQPGLCGLANGEDLYRAYISRWTSLDLPADRIHKKGLADLADISAERAEAAGRLGYASPEAAARAFAEDARGPRDREELLSVARGLVERSWTASQTVVSRLPANNCAVELVDRSLEADVLEYYEPASEERPAVFFVNGANPASRPTYRLAAWTAHEANPGHHLQMALEQAETDRSALRRFTNEFASSAFVEGWGLYAERLADEIGFYRDDFDRLGMLDMQAFRCARLAIDTGIHAYGWSRDEAIDALLATGLSRTEAEIEADRYSAQPGQALTYRLGQLVIEECRRVTSSEGRDEIVRFHDKVLSLGSLPLAALERELTGREFEVV